MYQPYIPTALIIVPAGDFPELRLKAWASRIITAFLNVCLQDLCSRFTSDQRPGQLALAAAAFAKLAEWLLLVEQCPRYLSQVQADNIQRVSWEPLAINQQLHFWSTVDVRFRFYLF